MDLAFSLVNEQFTEMEITFGALFFAFPSMPLANIRFDSNILKSFCV